MKRYILRRLLIAIPVLFGITIIDYFLMSLSGSPLEMLFGPRITEAGIQARASALGLDKPIIVQYFYWLKEVIQGNLGISMKLHQPVSALIMKHIGPTLLLMGVSLVISLLISLPAGIYSAVKQYSKADYTIVTSSFIGSSIPSFFLGLVLTYVFAARLGWLPSSGMGTLGGEQSFGDLIRHMIMPVTTLVVSTTGSMTRYIRSGMLEILQENYVRTARAKGLGRFLVINKHALRNALNSVITIVGLQIPALFGGAVVVEQVFAWPGLGLLTMTAISGRDYPLIMGVALLSAVVVLISNLITDVLYALADPTITYE